MWPGCSGSGGNRMVPQGDGACQGQTGGPRKDAAHFPPAGPPSVSSRVEVVRWMVTAEVRQGGHSPGILRGLPVWLCPVGCGSWRESQAGSTGSSCIRTTILDGLSTCGFSKNGPRVGGT